MEVRIEKPSGQREVIFETQGQPIAGLEGIRVGIDRIAEIQIPFALLGREPMDPIHFFVELREGQQSRDRAPREGTIQLTRPSPDFEQIMWDV